MAHLPNQQLKAGIPAKSMGLSPRASAEWDRLVAELESSGIQVSKAHRTLITLAATIAADIADAWQSVKTDGAYIQNQKTGVMQAHPAAKRLDALRRDYIKVMSLLGMRSAKAADTGDSPTLEDILNG